MTPELLARLTARMQSRQWWNNFYTEIKAMPLEAPVEVFTIPNAARQLHADEGTRRRYYTIGARGVPISLNVQYKPAIDSPSE